MKTKKLLILSSIFLVGLQLNAQTFGVKGGLSLTNWLVKDDVENYGEYFNMKPGFHLGATFEYNISELLSAETGLFVETKGTKADNLSYMGYDGESKVNLFYLGVPILAKVTYELGNGFKVFGTAGPYLGLGLVGKIKATAESGNDEVSGESDVEWGEDEFLKRPDAGFTIGGGIELSAFQFGISYDLGLANITIDNDDGGKIKNRSFKLSAAYRIGNPFKK